MIHRRLLRLAGTVPGPVLLVAALGCVISALHVAFALTAAGLLASLASGGGASAAALLALALIALARAAVVWLREPVAAHLGAAVRIRLRHRLLARLVDAPGGRDEGHGEQAATLLDGVDGLDAYYTRYLPQLLVVLVVPAAIVVLVARESPSAGAVLGSAMAVAVLGPRLWDAQLMRGGRERWDRFADLTDRYSEALRAMPLLRSLGADARIGRELAGRAGSLARSTMAQMRFSLAESAISGLAIHLGTVLAVIAAVTAVAGGSAEAAAVVPVLLLTREAFRPLADLSGAWHAGYVGLLAVDGLARIDDLPSRAADAGRTPRPPAPGPEIRLEGVTFRYPGTDQGIHDLDLTIGAEEHLAIAGPSGSGKSTIARLLERDVDPDRGRILVDGTDLRDLTLDALRRGIVVVPQDPVLFSWTLAENLRLYRPGATDAELGRAVRAAGLEDVVAALPEGWDTPMGEDAARLSGGQRQRLALARALLARPAVLVLDEATSALDAATEQQVMQGVVREAAGATLVVIAHRRSAAPSADRWISVREGRLESTPAAAAGTEQR